MDHDLVSVFCQGAIACFLLGLFLGAAQIVSCDGSLLSYLADLVVQLHLDQFAAEELKPRADGLDARFAL